MAHERFQQFDNLLLLATGQLCGGFEQLTKTSGGTRPLGLRKTEQFVDSHA